MGRECEGREGTEATGRFPSRLCSYQKEGIVALEKEHEEALIEDGDRRLRMEDMTDPLIHARNEMVRQWVARAMRLSKDPDYDPEFLAGNTAYQIIRLFY